MTGLFVLVDLPRIKQALQNSLNNLFVAVAYCLCPFVVLDIEFSPEIDKLLRRLLDEFSRRNAGFCRRLLDFLSVLIDAGQKENFLTFESMIARNHIGQYFLVSVADMRWRIGVIDRRGDKKRLRHFCVHL